MVYVSGLVFMVGKVNNQVEIYMIGVDINVFIIMFEVICKNEIKLRSYNFI